MGLFPTLGSLQLEIIRVIAGSSERLVVNRIAKILDKGQTTIFKSVDLLLEAGVLRAERQSDGIRKFLMLTDKGVCHAVVSLDMHYEMILKNHPYLKPFPEVPIVQRLVRGQELRMHVYAEIAYHVVMTDDFYEADSRRLEQTKFAVEDMVRILRSISSSLEVEKGFEINRKEIDAYMEEIRQAMSKNLRAISEHLDKFESLMKKKGYGPSS